MKPSMTILALAIAALATMSFQAQADTTQAQIGKPAPAFELAGTDGKTHQLSDYKGKTVVIHFHSIQCPWAIAYQPILANIAKQFGPSNDQANSKRPEVVFLGINSNRSEPMDEIKANVAEANLPYIVLKDPHNLVADAYGAICTPDIFVIDQQGVLRYSGGLEKAPLSPEDVGTSSEQYLKPVIEALIAGKDLPVITSAATGCGIKRERKSS